MIQKDRYGSKDNIISIFSVIHTATNGIKCTAVMQLGEVVVFPVPLLNMRAEYMPFILP